VQAILDRHAGALAVESVEGEGSTFTIRLPKKAPTGAPEPGLIRLG
jgi:signal transduction histidine kinase